MSSEPWAGTLAGHEDPTVPPVELPPGSVAMRIRLFETQAIELSKVVRAPWPEWMHRLFALEHLALRTPDPEERVATLGAAVTALAERLKYRLGVVAFAVTAMEELGWRPEVDEDGILLVREGTARDAVDELERAGIYGPLCKVVQVDSTGMPWIGGG